MSHQPMRVIHRPERQEIKKKIQKQHVFSSDPDGGMQTLCVGGWWMCSSPGPTQPHLQPLDSQLRDAHPSDALPASEARLSPGGGVGRNKSLFAVFTEELKKKK